MQSDFSFAGEMRLAGEFCKESVLLEFAGFEPQLAAEWEPGLRLTRETCQTGRKLQNFVDAILVNDPVYVLVRAQRARICTYLIQIEVFQRK